MTAQLAYMTTGRERKGLKVKLGPLYISQEVNESESI